MFRTGLYARVSTNVQQTLTIRTGRCGSTPPDAAGHEVDHAELRRENDLSPAMLDVSWMGEGKSTVRQSAMMAGLCSPRCSRYRAPLCPRRKPPPPSGRSRLFVRVAARHRFDQRPGSRRLLPPRDLPMPAAPPVVNLYGRSIGIAFPHRLLPRSKGGLVAWDSVRHSSPVVVVEGLFDLAVLWQAGFCNTTCAFGTHLT